MNRALYDETSFYCLVNCHLLSFEVCREIEDRLSKLGDHQVQNYGLAFIYDEQSRDARIKAYLDKHLIGFHPMAEISKIRDYVQMILAARSSSYDFTASSVDSTR